MEVTPETRFKKVKPLLDLPQIPESIPTPVFVKLPSLEIDESTHSPPAPVIMDTSKPHIASVTFAKLPAEELGTPLIDHKPPLQQPKLDIDEESEATVKTKKPFKVHYYKDEKSLQFSIDFKRQKKADTGCLSQLKFRSFYQACFGEFVGTYILVLFAVGFGLHSDPADTSAGLTGAIVTGLLIATLVWCLAQVSGCNINPAVSLALLVSGDTNIIRVLFYVPCQLLGSCLAIVTLRGMMIQQDGISEVPNGVNGTQIQTIPQIGLTLLNPSISPIQGILVEILITFVLIITIFACVDAHRKDLGGSFPLTIGFAVTVGAFMGGQFTGGSMNPARSFGPAFVSGNMSHHYIYWLGPCTGAVLAAITYKLLTFKTSVSVVKSRGI